MKFIEKFKSILPKEINFEELKDTVAADIWENKPENAAIIFLKRNELFDLKKYLSENIDIKNCNIDPIKHFIYYGINEKRKFFKKNKENQIYKTKNIKPKVSVIIPIYNNYDYIIQCISSVQNQKLKEIEILLINDGSTDGRILPLLKTISKNDKRCIVINKKNTGYGNTLNIGINKSSGEYIGIVESDDFINKNMYYELYKIAKENKCEIVKSDFDRFVIKDGKYEFTHYKVTEDDNYYNKIIDTSDDLETFRFTMNTWNGIYKRQFLIKNKIKHNETSGAAFQDNGFYFQIFMNCKRAYFTQNSYYMNRRDNENSSVFAKDKVYAFTREYNFIDKIIQSNKRYDKFYPVSLLKRFQNYKFNCNRIDKRRLNEFIDNIRDEFLQLFNNKKLNMSFFSLREKKEMTLLLDSKEKFIEKIFK